MSFGFRKSNNFVWTLFSAVLISSILLLPLQVNAAAPRSKALENLMRQQDQLNKNININSAAFNKLVNEYKTLLKQSPTEKHLIYIQLGKMYSEIRDHNMRNYSEAVQYYNEALNCLGQDDEPLRGEVFKDIAFSYYRPSSFHNIAKAREYFIKAAEINRYHAVQLARMSLFAWGGPCDYFLACCLYDIATRDGWEGGMENYCYLLHVTDLDAAGKLDTMHISGLEKGYFYRVVADQPSRSFTSMILTAEIGFATAEFEMGLVYGEDPAFKNIDEAFRWYRLASDHGYDPARAKLAQLCLAYTLDTASGNVFEKQANGKYPARVYDQVYNECEKLLMIPASHGFAQAQLYLGQMFKNGCPNGTIKHNYRKAYYWLLLARTNGMTDAAAELAELDKIVDNASDQLMASDYKNIFLRVKEDAEKNDISITCLNRITHSTAWMKPKYMRSTYYTTKMGDKVPPFPDNKELPAQLASQYQETYGLYVSILKNMSRNHMEYSDHERKHYQEMMKRLRDHSEMVCPLADLKASPWESWDGK